MPRYRVLEKSYLPDGTTNTDGTPSGGCCIYEAGAEIEYDGWPSHNLEPLDEEARAKQAEHVQREEQRKAAMSPQPGDIAFTAEMMAILAGLLNTHGTTGVAVPADVKDAK